MSKKKLHGSPSVPLGLQAPPMQNVPAGHA
jgi:hypothetical protein